MDRLNTRDRISFSQGNAIGTIDNAADRIKINGLVSVFQGDGENKKIIIDRAHNKWVKNGLRGLLSHFVTKYYFGVYALAADASRLSIYLGTDNSTSTTHSLTALVSPIGASPGTAPSSTNGEGITMISDGHWRIAFSAVFNLGTVSGTVGEVALYLGMPQALVPEGYVDGAFTKVMVSRCAVADGDFAPFTIDPSKSLAILWEVFISYE